MNLILPDIFDSKYKSNSQRARVITETWFKTEMYCPACGYNSLIKFNNNEKMADFFCEKCGEIYELKSTSHNISKNIIDGAYSAAIERIMSNKNPHLLVLQYDKNIIKNLIFTPKYFFTPEYIQARNPLSEKAQRAGYVGCIILFGNIPEYGKINIVKSNIEQDKKIVLEKYSQSLKIKIENVNLRGWLMDIIKCVDKITHEVFTLKDMYEFVPELSKKHQDNYNIEAKIRQQLQILRGKGFIEFVDKGVYRKIL